MKEMGVRGAGVGVLAGGVESDKNDDHKGQSNPRGI